MIENKFEMVSANLFLLISHSQTTTIRQPSASSADFVLMSRSIFSENFFSQNSRFDFGVDAFEHPSCLCQKQPCTRMINRSFGSTISGVPGKSFLWSLNLYPAACNADLTFFSATESLLRTFDIISLRFSGETMSVPVSFFINFFNRDTWNLP